jgi:cell division septation protein DedD
MRVAAAAFASAFLLTGGFPVVAVPSAKAASQEDARKALQEKLAAAARAAYDAGLKAYAKGKYQSAVDELSKAVKAGSLTNAEMAKALYTRGLAYKKQNKPGLAISDLTSALWLKNGLSADDRKKATAERSEAYKMAGIQDTGEGLERAVVANPNAGSGASTSTGADSSSAGLSAAAVAQSAAAHSGSGADGDSDASAGVTRQDANSESAQDAARARAAYGTVHGNGLQAAASATVVGNDASAESPKVVTVSPSTSSSISTSVSNFFSNIFGGGTSAPPEESQQPASVTTASTSPVEPEISSWSSATSVSGAHTKPATAPTKAASSSHPQKVAATAHKAKPRGKYKVHIAALRSREDAEALAHKLMAQHAADLDNHTPTVDKAVIGSMGTFYRVRIGGYASADEPRSLCNKLRTSGLDCLVVTN